VILRITGELDACSASRLEEQILAGAAPQSGRLILDLGDLEFIDSSGIRLLIQVLAWKSSETQALLVYPRAVTARRALGIVGIERIIRTVDTLQDALGGAEL
jgi:anti-anti-sigma factor